MSTSLLVEAGDNTELSFAEENPINVFEAASEDIHVLAVDELVRLGAVISIGALLDQDGSFGADEVVLLELIAAVEALVDQEMVPVRSVEVGNLPAVYC